MRCDWKTAGNQIETSLWRRNRKFLLSKYWKSDLNTQKILPVSLNTNRKSCYGESKTYNCKIVIDRHEKLVMGGKSRISTKVQVKSVKQQG